MGKIILLTLSYCGHVSPYFLKDFTAIIPKVRPPMHWKDQSKKKQQSPFVDVRKK